MDENKNTNEDVRGGGSSLSGVDQDSNTGSSGSPRSTDTQRVRTLLEGERTLLEGGRTESAGREVEDTGGYQELYVSEKDRLERTSESAEERVKRHSKEDETQFHAFERLIKDWRSFGGSKKDLGVNFFYFPYVRMGRIIPTWAAGVNNPFNFAKENDCLDFIKNNTEDLHTFFGVKPKLNKFKKQELIGDE